MRRTALMALGAMALFAVSGCSAMRERRWGWCAVGGGILGAAVGAGTAGGLVNAYEKRRNDEDTGAAAGAGAVGGAVVGTLLGHLICDPRMETPPPPPVAQLPPPPAPPPGTKMVELHGPHFDFDRSELKPEGKRRVDEGVRVMKEHPSMRVSVEGHTDAIGSVAYNQKLSERRAKTVRDYMVSQGIESSRISTEGFGKSRPIASNDTAEGRAQNRRVEIIAQ